MAFEVQYQHPPPLHDRGVLTGFSLTCLRSNHSGRAFIIYTYSYTYIEEPCSIPVCCQTSFKLKETTMSRRNGPKLDLKLNLSPPRANMQVASPSRSALVSPTTPPSSCVSSELNQDSGSPETTSMMLVGCPRCLMYVMLLEEDPRCPKCKSTVLLDVLHDNGNGATTTVAATTKKTKKR